MYRNRMIIGIAAVVLATSWSAHAGMRVDFSDDPQSSLPGFRIVDQAIEAPNILDRLKLGSAAPLNADGLDYLRINAVDNGAMDVLGFIVLIPEMKLINDHGADGMGSDMFSVIFPGGINNGLTVAGGFRVYHLLATNLSANELLLTADITLTEPMVTLGSSGQLEATPQISLGNVQLVNDGIGNDGQNFATLAAFHAEAMMGADFVSGIFSAGSVMGQKILMQGSNPAGELTGSAAGSFLAVVPEPATLGFLLVGGLLAMRRRRR